jgi:hypothetical protein
MVFRLLPQIYSHANQCPYRRFKTIDCRVRWTLDRCLSVYGDHTHYRCVIVEAIALVWGRNFTIDLTFSLRNLATWHTANSHLQKSLYFCIWVYVLSQISVLRNISLIIFPRAQLRVYVLQGRLGSSSKWSICSSRLRTQLKIRAVKVYVLGRLGPSCKSVYVLIDFPQDPAFQYEYTPWGPLSTQLFADKNTVYRAVVPHFHNPTNLVFLCVSLY